ncbi:MAG: ATP-binding protein [Bacteroidota bacterium]
MPENTKTFELSVPSEINQVAKVEQFLMKIKHFLKMDEEHFYKLLVATTEAVNNSIIHGNRRDPGKLVMLTCSVNSSEIVMYVHDEGPGFDAAHLPDPLADENLMRDHGRGVFLIRSLMDRVIFQHNTNGAEVIMTLLLKQN